MNSKLDECLRKDQRMHGDCLSRCNRDYSNVKIVCDWEDCKYVDSPKIYECYADCKKDGEIRREECDNTHPFLSLLRNVGTNSLNLEECSQKVGQKWYIDSQKCYNNNDMKDIPKCLSLREKELKDDLKKCFQRYTFLGKLSTLLEKKV